MARHDCLGRAGGAGGENDDRRVVRGYLGLHSGHGGGVGLGPGEQEREEGARSFAVGADALETRQVFKLGDKLRSVMAEEAADAEHPDIGETQDALQVILLKHGVDQHSHRADALDSQEKRQGFHFSLSEYTDVVTLDNAIAYKF